MYCMHCGAQVADGAKFCAMCGAPVADAAPSASQPQAVPAQQQTPSIGAQYPFGAVAPQPVKKKSPLPIILGILAVLAIAGVVVAGFMTNWFGLVPSNPVRVLARQTTSIVSSDATQSTTISYGRGNNGILHSIRVEATQNDESEEGNIDLTCDNDGVPTMVTVHEEDDDYAPIITISADKDQLGRVLSLRYAIEGEVIMTAAYEYDGDTDNILAITYGTDSGDMLLSTISLLSINEIAPYVSCATTNLVGGFGDCRIEFDADGRMLSYDVAGTKVTNDVPSREERASRTLNNEVGTNSTVSTYDAQGYLVHYEASYEESDFSQTVDSEWITVNNPSRWLATIGRLD